MHSNGQNTNSLSFQAMAAISALGVVYGDIGTSPLYALKESFHHAHNLTVNIPNIYGILSLIFWSLIIVISVKYVFFILKADRNGEGGILALTNLVISEKNIPLLLLFGLFGTALLYGDGMITPAISVLSAVEGLSLITPVFDPYIIPITIAILVVLFSIQKHGTALVGKIFGPVTLIWFIVLGSIGIYNIVKHPEILLAINPYYALQFFYLNSINGFLVLGSVFLVITGGEALYSDLGHFGRLPITRAWFFIVLPCLILNYFGQGAFLLTNPAAIKNPFFLMAPDWALIPLVILATMATVIASQALITGVFSLTMQAVQSGFISRVKIVHTSEHERGQIYIRFMNNFLMISCVVLVLSFKTSSNLAAAYGIAVTTTMAITTILFHQYAVTHWKWNKYYAGSICGFFLVIDLAFFGANVIKVLDGGWVPLLIAVSIFILMTTWKKGRMILAKYLAHKTIPLADFIKKINDENAIRVPGTAIYLNSAIKSAPYALFHTYEYFHAVHEKMIFVSVQTMDVPFQSDEDRFEISELYQNIHSIKLKFGYLENQNVPKELAKIQINKQYIKPHEAIYFLGKEKIFATNILGMAIWREKLFAFLNLNSLDATNHFSLPQSRVVEIGVHVEI